MLIATKEDLLEEPEQKIPELTPDANLQEIQYYNLEKDYESLEKDYENLEKENESLIEVVKFDVLFDSRTFLPNLYKMTKSDQTFLQKKENFMYKRKFEFFELSWKHYKDEIKEFKNHPELIEETNLVIENIKNCLEQ